MHTEAPAQVLIAFARRPQAQRNAIGFTQMQCVEDAFALRRYGLVDDCYHGMSLSDQLMLTRKSRLTRCS